jgi:tetratricopeptide (TPR) repeat protein
MQADLGNCYFESQDWTQAEASFRIAAESDKADASSAYNLGLSLLRQGYTVDARNWFKEALNRKPDEALRAKILGAMR